MTDWQKHCHNLKAISIFLNKLLNYCYIKLTINRQLAQWKFGLNITKLLTIIMSNVVHKLENSEPEPESKPWSL